jgi:hypothetical protein
MAQQRCAYADTRFVLLMTLVFVDFYCYWQVWRMVIQSLTKRKVWTGAAGAKKIQFRAGAGY